MANGPIAYFAKSPDSQEEVIWLADGYECDHCRCQCACNEHPAVNNQGQLLKEFRSSTVTFVSSPVDLSGGAADNGDSLCSVCHEAYRKGNK